MTFRSVIVFALMMSAPITGCVDAHASSVDSSYIELNRLLAGVIATLPQTIFWGSVLLIGLHYLVPPQRG